MTLRMLEENRKKFMEGKIPPSEYGKHVLKNAVLKDKYTETVNNADKFIKKLKSN